MAQVKPATILAGLGCGLWLSACAVHDPSVVLSVKDQRKADDIATGEDVARLEKQGISPLILAGPVARKPARCLPTRQPGVFVCRLVSKLYKRSPWVARDARLRKNDGVWVYDSGRYDTLDGPYRLAALDGPASTAVCYDRRVDCVERIPGAVFSWGWNATYVVAASHPRSAAGEIDKSQTRYFYIVRANDHRDAGADAAVRGPFTAQAYQDEQRRLGLPELGSYYPDLK
jgi:hypothetical protein